jgi:hypothetical protein
VQILRRARDLGIVRDLPDDGVLKMNASSEEARILNAFDSTTPLDQKGE